MAGDLHAEIPETGAIFTFGRSRFANNAASHFFIRNDPVVEISCGDEHTAVICQNGRVFAFGSNSWGQLGLGHKNTATMPSCIKSLKPEKAIHVACGKSHTLVSTVSGKVFAFGSNTDCQLGLGDSESRSLPEEIAGVEAGAGAGDNRVLGLAAGSAHSAALTADGRVFVWGSNSEGQLGLGDGVTVVDRPRCLDISMKVVHVSCGYYHTAFVTDEGKLLTCGEGENGKLGLGKDNSNVFTPRAVDMSRARSAPVRYAVCGGNHTVAITMGGEVYGFGSNLSGQLGLGREILMFTVPECVESLVGKNICFAACGESHTAFLTEDNLLYTCGDGRYGKLCKDQDDENEGPAQYTPHLSTRFNQYRVTQVACGGCHTMVQASLNLEPAEETYAASANGEVTLTLEKMGAATEENGPSSLGRVLPPLHHTPTMNDSLPKEVGDEVNNKTIINSAPLCAPEEDEAEMSSLRAQAGDILSNGHTNGMEDDDNDKEDSSKIMDEINNATNLKIGELSEDMYQKFNLRDASDLTGDDNTSDKTDTPATIEAEEDQKSSDGTEETVAELKNDKITNGGTKTEINDRRCSVDITPTVTVTGTDGVDVNSEDANIEANGKTNNRNNGYINQDGEGRMAKFLNNFRRKKLSEKDVSVSPAWTENKKKTTNNMLMQTITKKTSSTNSRSGQVHKSKACTIL